MKGILDVCVGGIYGNFREISMGIEMERHYDLIAWLTRMRFEIFNNLCSEHCCRARVSRGVEIHVANAFNNYAHGEKWHIFKGQAKPIDDAYANVMFTKIDEKVIRSFHAEFLHRYNFGSILDWMFKYLFAGLIASLRDLSIKLCLRNIFCKRLEQIWEFLFESKAEVNAILAEIL